MREEWVSIHSAFWKIVPDLKEIEMTWNEEVTEKTSGMQRDLKPYFSERL